jgi:hypothetical protein
VTPRQLVRIVVSLLVASFALPAGAAPRDLATQKKIEEALTVHYLAADYDKAENVLIAALKACGTTFCSPEMMSRAYVAVGVIRGNGKQDLAGARVAFENAKASDPTATLDATLATPAVLKEFYKVMEREPPPDLAKQVETGEPPPVAESKEKELPRVSPAGDLRCTPASGYEIQTAQPIAVVCEPLEGVVRAELYYRNAGDPEYTAMLMSIQDGTLRANIPCEALPKPGKLEVYIIAQDINKEMIDTFGNILTPAFYQIVPKTSQPVPSYPGQPPPKRCTEMFTGAGAAGSPCTDEQPCRSGNYCAEGICRKSPTCETDVDCESNRCNQGFCVMTEEFADKEPSRWMVGLHAAQDVWLAGGSKQVCGNDSVLSGKFNCYSRGSKQVFQNPPNHSTVPITDPGAGGDVGAGLKLATTRVLVSVDYVLTRFLSVGGRVGWAFLGGGPRTIHYQGDSEPKITQHKSFVPIHIEARGTLWLRSLSKPGLHPYVLAGFGFAEVDAKIEITGTWNNERKQLDAWRKMGTQFLTGGFGGLYTMGRQRRHGIQLNFDLMYMFPSTGLVLQPSLGYVLSF